MMDAEQGLLHYAHFTNTSVECLSWRSVSVTVGERGSKARKALLSGVGYEGHAGEMLAIMGPSGSGKTTLLSYLADRPVHGSAFEGERRINGQLGTSSQIRHISSFVEQEDVLMGSLTVAETMDFAAKLALPTSVSKTERRKRVQALIAAFGLQNQANALVGTPIRKGISGGQKRRLSIASQLITSPKILFMDEPTSGLDSAASAEVMSFLKAVAKEHKLIVIASIHQPSAKVYNMFDQLVLLSGGRTAYAGPLDMVEPYFQNLGLPLPNHVNPAEHLLDLTNVDFASIGSAPHTRLEHILGSYTSVDGRPDQIQAKPEAVTSSRAVDDARGQSANPLRIVFTLVHRSLIKSYRDVVAYGIRIAMYMGLAILMGTCWLRLKNDQSDIQPFINAIFFGGAFMSFMAVAYIPAFLEDRALFVKERANGLYNAGSFMTANFLVGVPMLFFICILFSIIAYWLIGLDGTVSGFFWWVLWLYLDLLAAESLVVLISAVVPIFVVALVCVAFANGLWMAVGGFLVPPRTLNVFWRYVFHYIDYQGYVFQGMMVNQFNNTNYTCGSKCQCTYVTELENQCKIAGSGVLQSYGYNADKRGEWIGILIGIILVYRLLGWAALHVRRT